MYTCYKHIQPHEDAFTLWNKIVSKYEQKTTYSIADAYRLFHSYKVRANSIDFVGYQNDINRRITECNKALLHDKPLPGHVFGEQYKAMIMIDNLPASYATDIAILMNQPRVVPADVYRLVQRKMDEMRHKSGHVHTMQHLMN